MSSLQFFWPIRSSSDTAQQPRSNSALRTHTNHHAPVFLLWCNALLREGSWWAPWRGSLDGMQGVRGSKPLSSTTGQSYYGGGQIVWPLRRLTCTDAKQHHPI
jgi:hypothetical protein